MKKLVSIALLLFVCCTMFVACGQEATNAIAQKAIEAYIDIYLGEMKTEDVKKVLAEQKEALAIKAFKNFTEVQEIQDLGVKDRAKQAVLLAVKELSGKPPAE